VAELQCRPSRALDFYGGVVRALTDPASECRPVRAWGTARFTFKGRAARAVGQAERCKRRALPVGLTRNDQQCRPAGALETVFILASVLGFASQATRSSSLCDLETSQLAPPASSPTTIAVLLPVVMVVLSRVPFQPSLFERPCAFVKKNARRSSAVSDDRRASLTRQKIRRSWQFGRLDSRTRLIWRRKRSCLSLDIGSSRQRS